MTYLLKRKTRKISASINWACGYSFLGCLVYFSRLLSHTRLFNLFAISPDHDEGRPKMRADPTTVLVVSPLRTTLVVFYGLPMGCLTLRGSASIQSRVPGRCPGLSCLHPSGPVTFCILRGYLPGQRI